ncbi:MAG TPA: aspartate 1-decarboxylase [Gammaproteobacteria bacterium]|nr:aspartate 1-decarboxylase [Gammaproteobacteria bacterium]
MQITLLKCKLHRVRVTHAELDYEGSCAIDLRLMEAAGIREYEQIQVYNLANGERFTTYAMPAEPGSGIISINGAAAHKARPRDEIIVCAYAALDEQQAARFKPRLVYVDACNRVTRIGNAIPTQVASSS